MIGTIARGAVLAVTGALVVDAGVTYDPSKSTGLDGALRTLARHSYGPWLLAVLGLIAFDRSASRPACCGGWWLWQLTRSMKN